MGWKLDFKRFRIYLTEKYGVSKAYLFIGYLAENQELYRSLQEFGYVLIFKPVMKNKDGELKGNVDAELVLHAMIEFPNYESALIISGDGDFYCLVEYLKKQNKLLKLLIPDRYKYSALLRKFASDMAFISDLKEKLAYKGE